MAVYIFFPAPKQEIFKRQRRMQLIELSVVFDCGQQHKPAHILVIGRARAKKN